MIGKRKKKKKKKMKILPEILILTTSIGFTTFRFSKTPIKSKFPPGILGDVFKLFPQSCNFLSGLSLTKGLSSSGNEAWSKG